jgi:hypothetical protein
MSGYFHLAHVRRAKIRRKWRGADVVFSETSFPKTNVSRCILALPFWWSDNIITVSSWLAKKRLWGSHEHIECIIIGEKDRAKWYNTCTNYRSKRRKNNCHNLAHLVLTGQHSSQFSFLRHHHFPDHDDTSAISVFQIACIAMVTGIVSFFLSIESLPIIETDDWYSWIPARRKKWASKQCEVKKDLDK